MNVDDFDFIEFSELKEAAYPTEAPFTAWTENLFGLISRPTWILHTLQTYCHAGLVLPDNRLGGSGDNHSLHPSVAHCKEMLLLTKEPLAYPNSA